MKDSSINSNPSSGQAFEPIVAVDGVIGAGISPQDRGFNYGDGLFETVRMVNSKGVACLPLWSLHLQRLVDSCTRLDIKLDLKTLDSAIEQMKTQFVVLGVAEVVLKIVVTRGVGGRGYLPSVGQQPTLCVGIYPSASYPAENYAQGIAVHLCRQKLSVNAALAGMKHLNKLEYVLARTEWRDMSVSEALLLDQNDLVADGTFSNVFAVRSGVLVTPALEECGVAGVMRRVIVEILASRLVLAVEFARLSLDDLFSCDEVFVCNSVYGIWPVVSLLDARWPCGSVVRSLQAELNSYLIELGGVAVC